MTDPVLYEERDDIAIITLNRPHKKNALNEAVIQGMADGIDAATKSPMWSPSCCAAKAAR